MIPRKLIKPLGTMAECRKGIMYLQMLLRYCDTVLLRMTRRRGDAATRR